MKFNRIIVSDDNKLVLSDYNLNESNSEILDLNKSISDVIKEKDVQNFINTSVTSSKKIYFVCLKENFGSHEQRIENIADLKSKYKMLKKLFKKENVFFFIYNTFDKNEQAYAPSLGSNESNIIQSEQTNKVTSNNEIKKTDEVNPFIQKDKEFNNKVSDNFFDEKNSSQNLNKPEVKNVEVNKQNNVDNILNDFVSNKNYDLEVSPSIEKNVEAYVVSPQSKVETESLLENSNVKPTEKVEPISQNKTVEPVIVKKDINDIDLSIDTEAIKPNVGEIKVPSSPLKPIIESTTKDEKYLVDTDWNNLDTAYFETSPESAFEEDDSIEIPESYFNVDNSDLMIDEDLYSDYLNFKDSYELNVHALKSIYDFIWRMLILNNYNLKVTDLLYLSVNNLSAFSIGQSDFVRQTSLKSESLFDLIMQLDVKLEFNNTLFYIYLAEFFTVKLNKIIINETFLSTLSIWVNKNSKHKFIEQIEKFINFSAIYNKKIIFSHFIELANFIKGSLLSIKPTLNLIDIHRLAINKYKSIRSENVFGFIVLKINEIFNKVGIFIESELFDTPDNMYDKNRKIDDNLTWKDQLISLYQRLLLNVKNFILSKGNNETEVFNLYVDIKDLKMYNVKLDDSSTFFENQFSNIMSQTPAGGGFTTIGDAFNRTFSTVPNENNDYKNQNTLDVKKDQYVNYLNSAKNKLEEQKEVIEKEQINLANTVDSLSLADQYYKNAQNLNDSIDKSEAILKDDSIAENKALDSVKNNTKEIYSNEIIIDPVSLSKSTDKIFTNEKNNLVVDNKDVIELKVDDNKILNKKTQIDLFANEVDFAKKNLDNFTTDNDQLIKNVTEDLMNAEKIKFNIDSILNDKNDDSKIISDDLLSDLGETIDHSKTIDDEFDHPSSSIINNNLNVEDINFSVDNTTSNNSQDLMLSKIEQYEKKIKDNIAKIEAERKLLKEKMEILKNI